MDDQLDAAATSSQSLSPKRRRFSRVSRACTECRVRKIRCDGKQKCQPCKDFDRRCHYSSTKAQRTAGAPRTKILEDRLRRARALIAKLQSQSPSSQNQAEFDAIFDSPNASPQSGEESQTPSASETDKPVPDLETMLDGQGLLTPADDNTVEYFGGASGFTFLKRSQQLFDNGDQGHDSSAAQLAMSRLFDSPLPDKQALNANVSLPHLLPPRKTTTRLLHVVFHQTYPLFQFLHEPTFQRQTDRIYNIDPIDFNDEDHDFLPLFFSAVAIGYLFDQQTHQNYGCARAIGQAMRHFIAARQMVDVNTCREPLTLQAILCLVLFLLSTARVATAHTFIGLAVAAAMRMGLHSQTTSESFSELETDSRRRIFWTIVKLDILTSNVLGLPGLVNMDYVDQIRSSGNVHEYNGNGQEGDSSTSGVRMFAASAQYLDLLLIISKTTSKLYPKTEEEARQIRSSKKFMISSSVISEIEDDFKAWRERLPEALDAVDQPPSASLTTITYELEMVHNCGHILLYRPFLHYLAKINTSDPPDNRQLRCAASCIKISRVTISRSDQMLRQGFLAPAAWQSVYTIFLSVVTLIFFLATQHGAGDYEKVKEETERGIRILAATSCQDIGSKRCLDVLKVLLERLSQMVDIDIGKIEQKAPSLCQIKSPQREQDQSGSMQVSPQLAQQFVTTSSQTSPPSTTSAVAHLSQMPGWNPGPGGEFQPHSYNDPFMMYTHTNDLSLSTAYSDLDASSSSAMNPEQYTGHLEVPWADAFAWPLDPMVDDGGNTPQQVHGGQSQPDSTSSLKSEDIAAFMRINPGEYPFQ